MTTPKDEAHEQLRAWASGQYPLEAATELLIRSFHGRFVEPGWPWMHPTVHGQWIDFAAIPEQIGGLSGGEQRLLRIASSIGSRDVTVNLGGCLTGLDRPTLHLVLAAVAHAAGSHRHREVTTNPNGTITLTTPGSPHPWGTTEEPPVDAVRVTGRSL
ncbi:MAG TPA: hypothetical protein VIJ00_16625 [Nakamurella sp.]